MVHRIEDGDIIKILPFIINGNEKFCIKVTSLFTRSGSVIYDDSNNYLNKLYFEHRRSYKWNISTKYAFNSIVNDKEEIEVILLGRTLYDLIINNENLLDINCDRHLFISKEMKSIEHLGFQIPNYENSYIVKRKWDGTKFDKDYINKNQTNFIEYIKDKTPIKMKNEIIKEFGSDILGDLISKEREEKLNKVLN